MGSGIRLLAALLLTGVPSLSAAPIADPDARAAATEARMTDDERFRLLHGIMPMVIPGRSVVIAAGVQPSAGYIAGVSRLGVPALRESDAGLGVANMGEMRKGDVATALPSGLALASSFDPDLLFRGGAMIGGQARAKGFNVLLAGGVNLTRDPRGGRNFEYLGEDPLLAGTLAGSAIRGIQSRGVISTIKHFALNAQETQRSTLDAHIAEAGFRESDLLAFQIAIEQGQPGAVMCSYNLVNGAYGCGNDPLLNGVLKRDWGYKGWVLSDWGAVHEVGYFTAGLDQQSGSQIDKQVWFDAPLKAELAAGRVPRARVSDAVRRILRSVYAVGADWPEVRTPIDFAADAKVAREAAARGIVLLKNDGVLPIAASARHILVVGGHANVGVISGGGSSQVVPVGGAAAFIPAGGPGFLAMVGRQLIVPSSPLAALRAARPDATVAYDSGYVPEAAAAAARRADLVIVFATEWQTEGADKATLALPQGQDALIAAVAAANPNVVVVLETGNPVAMPWLDQVRGVIEAWYPGQEGGPAIADVLTGAVNPSGRLPITFPRDLSQNPRPVIPGFDQAEGARVTVEYPEGADVGYRWFAAKGLSPLFAFGHGLGYAPFAHGAPTATVNGRTIRVQFDVTNRGTVSGIDTPQLYVISAAGKPMRRLAAFARIELKPGETKRVSLLAEPRILAEWANGRWRIGGGRYGLAVADSAGDPGRSFVVEMAGQAW